MAQLAVGITTRSPLGHDFLTKKGTRGYLKMAAGLCMGPRCDFYDIGAKTILLYLGTDKEQHGQNYLQTLSHEVGHYLDHRLPLLATSPYSRDITQQREMTADVFALLWHWRDNPTDRTAADSLADYRRHRLIAAADRNHYTVPAITQALAWAAQHNPASLSLRELANQSRALAAAGHTALANDTFWQQQTTEPLAKSTRMLG